MKNKALTCFLSVVGALLISATNGFSESSFGTVVNNACAPVIVYTGNCALCHLADRSASTPAKTAYSAGGTTLKNFFCPPAPPPPPTCTDKDGDSYKVEGGTCGPVDCNDANAAVNPGAAENCTDNIDNNCNALIDAQDPAAVGCPVLAPDINLSPATLTFGSVLIGNSSARSAVIQNLGTAALVVSAIAPAGGMSSEFSSIPGAPFTIPAGGSRTVTVTYQPVDAGTDNGSLVISSNDPDEPTVSLTFNGTGDAVPTPDIDVSPTTLSFNTVMIRNKFPKTLIVQNLGTADVTIYAINHCPETSSEFSWPPTAPFTLQAKTAMTLSVIYAPLGEGTDVGCLSIESDDPDEATVKIGLQAAGVLYKSSILRFLSPVLNAAGRTANHEDESGDIPENQQQ